MQRITEERFQELARDAEILAQDPHGIKVMRLQDGRYAKCFRRKRLLSSAAWFPYAERFRRAATRLAERGIPTVTVELTARVPSQCRDVVVYRPLDGGTLRDVLLETKEPDSLMERFAAFLGRLHELGVYFRAMHLANVLVTPAGPFGLIDISECRVRRAPLPRRLRVRNFKPLVRYEVDRSFLDAFGVERFVRVYADVAGLSDQQGNRFMADLRKLHAFYRDRLN